MEIAESRATLDNPRRKPEASAGRHSFGSQPVRPRLSPQIAAACGDSGSPASGTTAISPPLVQFAHQVPPSLGGLRH